MDVTLVAFTILSGVLIGWSIGANDAANSMGTAVGARILTIRQAIVLIAIFGFLGAWLQGGEVVKTIGNDILPMKNLTPRYAAEVALSSVLGGCVWVILATMWKMPISTSHSIVGAVTGAGLALNTSILNGVPHVEIKTKLLKNIFLCWLFTPVGAAVIGYILYKLAIPLFDRFVPEKYSRRILTALIVVSGCFVAYTWGANDVANATGVLAGANVMEANDCLVLGGLAIVLGIVTWGYKVIETIGTQITQLLPLMAFCAQLASSINVLVYTHFGMPVSTSHSIVGAIFGVGLVKGLKVLNLKIMREIVVCWLATPFVSAILSFGIMKAFIYANQFWPV